MLRRHLPALLLTPALARAQGFPERTITLMNGFAAGGSSDIVARIAAPRLSTALGQTVVVENRPGAGGAVALEHVRQQRPDGHLVIISDPSALVIAPAVAPQTVRYRATEDFTAIALFGATPMVLVVNPAHPARSARELAEWLRAQGGRAAYASSGIGATPHLTGELFLQQGGGLEATHVPYRGGGLMLEAVIKNEVAFGFSVLNTAAQPIRSGLLRPLAVSSPARHPGFPEVPTTAEAGMPRLDIITWLMLLAPPRLPAPVLAAWSRAMAEALEDGPTRQRLTESGLDPARPMPPAEAAAFLAAEQARFAAIVQAAGARLGG